MRISKDLKQYIVANCNSCQRITFMKREFTGIFFSQNYIWEYSEQNT